MIWSKLDFEREVRRQLIELESIRKRVPADSDVRKRIDRLEASHVNLLRKLEEIFPSNKAPSTSSIPRRAQIERELRTLVKTSEVQTTALSVRQRISFSSALETATQGTTPESTMGGFPQGQELPTLDCRCASCGQILFSSLLAGESVLLSDGLWYHPVCHGDGEPYQKPGLLN